MDYFGYYAEGVRATLDEAFVENQGNGSGYSDGVEHEGQDVSPHDREHIEWRNSPSADESAVTPGRGAIMGMPGD